MSNDHIRNDEAAHRIFEATYFQPGSMYGSRADFYRDQRLERYQRDPAFRHLVDTKLEFSMANNPHFDSPVPSTAEKPASVIAVRDNEGNINFELSDDVAFHKDSRSTVKASDDTHDENGVSVGRDAVGRVQASVRMDGTAKIQSDEPKPITRIEVLPYPDQR